MDWPELKIGQIARVRRGASPRPKGDPRYFGGDIPWLKIRDVPEGTRYVTRTAEAVTEAGKAKSVFVGPGTLLLSNSASVGRPVITKIGACIHDGWLVLDQLAQSVDQSYLYWALTAHRERLIRLAPSGTQANLNTGIVATFSIPIPDLSEQRRIVDILDQAEHLRRLRVEADAKGNRILPALVTRVLGNPGTWEPGPHCRPLENLVRPVSGATPSKKTGRFWVNDMPWITPKDMKRDFLSDSKVHVSRAALDETNLKIIEQGSALIVVRGMILARNVPVALNLCPITINQDMKALIPKTKDVTGAYVWAALRLAKERLRALVRTAGHGTRKLDTPDLMQFSIPLPNSEQLKQVKFIVTNHRLSLERRQESKRLIDRLFAVTLKKAFDGSLTSAWRETHLNELLQEMEHQVSGDNSG